MLNVFISPRELLRYKTFQDKVKIISCNCRKLLITKNNRLFLCRILKSIVTVVILSQMFKRIRRMSFSPYVLWIKEVPRPELVLNLLRNINLARAFKLYRMEEDLFARLLFMMRSRDIFIRFTRYPVSSD